jgi:hypothetical protein
MKLKEIKDEAHKNARVAATTAAFNVKGVAYLDKKLNLLLEHNYYGTFMEKFVFKSNAVTVYNAEGKELDKIEGKKKESKSKGV